MPTSATKISCEEFQEQIPERLALNSDLDAEDHPLTSACPDCRQLMREYATSQRLLSNSDSDRELTSGQSPHNS